MGTNYYIELGRCDKCGRSDEWWHIGKSSYGWAFALHVEPDQGINDLKDVTEKMLEVGAKIANEYGRRLLVSEMVDHIVNRQRDETIEGELSDDDYAEFDVSIGLARAKVGGNCIGHGKGTYDLITGEFS